mgnify:CR=1 FL=1
MKKNIKMDKKNLTEVEENPITTEVKKETKTKKEQSKAGKIIDKIVTVSDDEAIKYAKELAFLEGIFVGISSGAALAGAINYIKENNIKDIMVVVIFPDTGERYLSTELACE